MTIKFEATVFEKSRAFRIAKAYRDQLGIDDGDMVYLVITTPAGDTFQEWKTLRSGADIYGRDVARFLEPGSRIWVEASQPVEVFRSPSEELEGVEDSEIDQVLIEGKRVMIVANRFERSRTARKECLATFGTTCQVCDFDFEQFYGRLGKGFIHVQHLRALSAIGDSYNVDPRTDLRPVCPNCHEMLHRTPDGPISIEKLREIIAERRPRENLVESSKHET